MANPPKMAFSYMLAAPRNAETSVKDDRLFLLVPLDKIVLTASRKSYPEKGLTKTRSAPKVSAISMVLDTHLSIVRIF